MSVVVLKESFMIISVLCGVDDMINYKSNCICN